MIWIDQSHPYGWIPRSFPEPILTSNRLQYKSLWSQPAFSSITVGCAASWSVAAGWACLVFVFVVLSGSRQLLHNVGRSNARASIHSRRRWAEVALLLCTKLNLPTANSPSPDGFTVLSALCVCVRWVEPRAAAAEGLERTVGLTQGPRWNSGTPPGHSYSRAAGAHTRSHLTTTDISRIFTKG